MVELDNGNFVLRKADSKDEPLVSINFSQEAKDMMFGNDSEVAKVMVSAGAQAVASFHQSRLEAERKHRVIH